MVVQEEDHAGRLQILPAQVAGREGVDAVGPQLRCDVGTRVFSLVDDEGGRAVGGRLELEELVGRGPGAPSPQSRPFDPYEELLPSEPGLGESDDRARSFFRLDRA